jgi:hypothetical protein
MSADRILGVAWPAFLAACVLELLVFAVLDPLEIQLGQLLGWGRQGTYTLAFFVFWAVCAAACALATLMRMPAPEVKPLPER